MTHMIRFLRLADGSPSPFDGMLLAGYDPMADPPLIEATDDPALALIFEDAAVAAECWRQSQGVRADGKPNRPLTRWTVQIFKAET